MPSRLELAPKMTGSTNSGPPQPPKDVVPKAEQYQLRGKMTPRPESGQPGQPMQLTPLWEHVVRTRRFPMSVDAESTFREISDRLRDPEWEVRQHALRVLVDVLPVLEQHVVDKLMVSIVPELVTNLGHPAPAVRKGALDTLRVYLCYSKDKENMFQKILDEGFNRPDALDNFQSNVSMGVILSVPSLLFPSAGSPRPPEGVLKFAINALASRLVQVTHQEAALRSLARIREIIGGPEFDSHMLENNTNVKRDFEVLCEVYRVNIHQDKQEKGDNKGDEVKEIVPLIKEWSSDSDSSSATDDRGDEDEDQDDVLVGPMPPARVVLETEIKFDEETAITMTILEEKDKESDTEESDSDSDFDAEDIGIVQVLDDAIPERRRTKRRVRFGGEIVKLRTPDSDEASIEKPEIPRTKIPLPLFPATKMPLDHRRSFSQPTSPTHSKHQKKRSLSSSPKREIYTHNALLSPKKSILTRPSSPVYVIQPVKSKKETRRNRKKKKNSTISNGVSENSTRIKQIKETSEADETVAKSSGTKEIGKSSNESEESTVPPELNKETIKLAKSATEDVQKIDGNVDSKDQNGDDGTVKTSEEVNSSRESPKRSSRPSSRVNFDVFPKQERNYILMELSSPERKKNAEKKSDFSSSEAAINDPSIGTNILTQKTEMAVSDQSLNEKIDNVSIALSQTSGGSEATMTQRFTTTMKKDRSNSSEVQSAKTVQELQSEKFHQDSRFSSNDSSVLLPRNLYTSKDIVGQSKRDVKVTSNATTKQDSENGGDMEVLVDKNRSFRELITSESRIGSNQDESESLTCSSSEGEGYSQEASWEELGLVDQETLNDLHNKDDWRARVRGLERLASVLKTSSALATVEPRLGSLLQAVLGGERSCRIAAAGMAVARVVIAGVSGDALRRRLPQLAWGLTRQGGPHAAQLARIAMLRLRPALFLEQLLQPHCLGARNGKTRENALQLLIFSLVTFPSTEFKVQTVARRVAETIGDRRRRVRQAALDTLAVLGQIYETEEVLEAGERAASGRHDCEAMKAAIRSRLARKSLPLVSADGLVVYGLQISPNVRIATGADVDWIVAGSGSLSPGSGRSRGQLIGLTARLDSASIFRSAESARSNPWTDRPDLVAVGIGVGSKEQPQPFAWQLVPSQNQDEQSPKEGVAWDSDGRNLSSGISNASSAVPHLYLRSHETLNTRITGGRQTLLSNKEDLVKGNNFIGSSSEDRLRLEEKLLKYCKTSNKCDNSVKRDTRSNGEVPNKLPKTPNEYLRQRFYEFCRQKARIRNINPPPQEGTVNRSESRIPVLHTRERGTPMKEGSIENLVRRGAGVGEGSRSGVTLNDILPRRITPGSSVPTTDGSNFNKLESQDTNVGYGSMYQRRRRLVERNSFQAVQVPPDVLNQFSFPGKRYVGPNGPSRKLPDHIDREQSNARGRVDFARQSPGLGNIVRESALPDMGMIDYQSVGVNGGLSYSSERRNRSKSRSQERHQDDEIKTTQTSQAPRSDTYGTMYQRRRRLIEGNAFRALQTCTLNGTSYYPQQMQNYSQQPSERVTPTHVAERSNRAEAIRESVQRLPERDQGSTEIPTVNLHEMRFGRAALQSSEKRLPRPRSRSDEKHMENNDGNTFIQRNSTIRNVDKAVVDDEDYDTQRRVSSRSSVYEIQSTSNRNSQYQANRSVHDVTTYDEDADRPVSGDSSNSNISITGNHHSEIRRLNDEDQHSQEENRSSNSPTSQNSRSSTPESQRNAAFDVVPFRTVPSRRNSVNSYAISLGSKRSNLADESIIALEISDEDSSSSDIEVDEQTNEPSTQDKLSHDFENSNAGDETDDTFESKVTRTRDSIRAPLGSAASEFSRKISNESIRGTISLKNSADSPRLSQSFQQLGEDDSVSSSNRYNSVSGGSRETVVSNHGIDRIFPRHEVSGNDTTIQNMVNSSPKVSDSFSEIVPDIADEDGEALLLSVLPDDTGSIQSLGSRSFQELDRPELYSNSNSASMARSSRSYSNADIEIEDDLQEDNVQRDHALVSPELRNSKGSSRTPSAKDVTARPNSNEILTPSKSSLSENPQSRNGVDLPNIAASRTGQSLPQEVSEPSKNQPSRVPRMKPRPRVNSIRANPPAVQTVSKPIEKPKVTAQLCFTQLESKDWEVIMKGLKTLSQIARQNPSQLESLGPGTLGRVIGRHVGNLRSQVSRAACLAAGEVFVAQPKGIEQETDDIAGALLHRTADTNKFLRADSNTALNRLAENIPPHKTIAVLIHRGAVHPNALVRATTARLLSEVVNRIGPDQAMTLPREIREKLLATGAKLLIDGNLDARKFAKEMFRPLSHRDGFQKALKDAVPDTTLRHIEKTLRSL